MFRLPPEKRLRKVCVSLKPETLRKIDEIAKITNEARGKIIDRLVARF